MIFRASLIAASLALPASSLFAANGPPLSGVWNIAPSGNAASSGELLFRVAPGDGSEPLDVRVPVHSGASDIAVARDIRRALSSQLPPERYNVELGEGANVLVRDPHGKPNFSLELINSGIDNLRVAVQSVTPAASPTVPQQAVPAEVPAPATPPAPGNSLPPQPRTSPPQPPSPATPQEIPPPRSSVPVPQPAIPPPQPSVPPPDTSTPPPTAR